MNAWPTWVEMWVLCFALYGVAKVFTFAAATVDGRPCDGRSAAYLFLWPGMDAAKFLDRRRPVATPPGREWAFAFGNMLLGFTLTWVVARECVAVAPLLAGWVGMVGGILCLHFGTFHLLSLAWQAAGVAAPPLMCGPHRATSITEFWGERWNHAFHLLVRQHVFRPLARRIGGLPALWAGFLVSGVVHDLVISVPARAGYGWPTLYFLLQALGVSIERTPLARTLGFERGVKGWLFTLLCVAGPAGLLFHRPFVERVMLPFLHALHAL